MLTRGSKALMAVAMGAAVLISASGSSSATTGVDQSGLAKAKAIVAGELKPPTRIEQTVPLPRRPPKGKLLIYLETPSVPANVYIAQAEEAAAKAIGWNFKTVIYDPSNPATLVQAFSTALIEHANVVSETGNDPSTFGAATIAAYQKAGVPIVVDAVASVPKSPIVIGDSGGGAAYMHSAKILAAWFVANSKGAGNVVIANVTAFSVTAAWGEAFQAEVKLLCPTCGQVLVPVPISEAVGGTEATLVASTLRRYPSYKYVVFDDGSFASGINAAIKSAGLTGIQIAGSDVQPQEAVALKAGEQAAWTGDNLEELGYGSVDYAVRFLEKVPLTTGDNLLPTQILTQKTIGNFSYFTEPANALQQYERLWKVPATS
jgi:hypothetical protein